jgi:hypothetical protein
MFGSKRRQAAAVKEAPAEAPVTVDDESPHDVVAALEAELDAAMAAAEKGEEGHRDLAVIEAEFHAAEHAARVAADLNTGASGNVTRKEFEEYKTATAVAFIGIEAALHDPTVSPREVLNLISAHVAAIGFSRSQAKALDDFAQRIDVVRRHYSNWDRETASERAHARHEAALRRPRYA